MNLIVGIAICIAASICLIGWIRQGKLSEELAYQLDVARANEKFASEQLAESRNRIDELLAEVKTLKAKANRKSTRKTK